MLYWIWLTQIKGIGPVLQKNLLAKFNDPLTIFSLKEHELVEVDGVGKNLANVIYSSKSLEEPKRILEEADKLNIRLLTYYDELYPIRAREQNESPILFYYRGTIANDIKGVAIVGTRRCTEYGKKITVDAAEFLAYNNIAVISGMAKGIDSYAHTACIKSGGYTIAFLGSGVDICYPREHEMLMKCIIEQGAVISSHPPKTPARPENFLKRNAFISAWSEKVLIPEAGIKSGALVTAKFAYKQSKEVFVAPHDIYSVSGKGCNELLKNGSSIYLSVDQLIDNKESTKADIIHKRVVQQEDKDKIKNVKNYELSEIEKKIIFSLKDESKRIEEISKEVGIDFLVVMTSISMLELFGFIETLPGNKYKIR